MSNNEKHAREVLIAVCGREPRNRDLEIFLFPGSQLFVLEKKCAAMCWACRSWGLCPL